MDWTGPGQIIAYAAMLCGFCAMSLIARQQKTSWAYWLLQVGSFTGWFTAGIYMRSGALIVESTVAGVLILLGIGSFVWRGR